MVQMYVWLSVAIVLAVGVLLLTVAATRGDGSVPGGQRTVAETVSQTWLDFRSGVSTLRARLTRSDRGTSAGGVAPGVGKPSAAQRAGAPDRVSVLPRSSRLLAGADGERHQATDAWSFETPQDTTIEDFFAATQTSEPAYLDTAQVSDVLHRRR